MLCDKNMPGIHKVMNMREYVWKIPETELKINVQAK